jgi:hypothetical protein
LRYVFRCRAAVHPIAHEAAELSDVGVVHNSGTDAVASDLLDERVIVGVTRVTRWRRVPPGTQLSRGRWRYAWPVIHEKLLVAAPGTTVGSPRVTPDGESVSDCQNQS